MGMVAKQSIPADPTGEMLRLIGAFAGQAHPATRDGVWISPDGSRALLMVQTAAQGFDLDAQERDLHQIDAAFAAARHAVPADMQAQAAGARLIETGPPVFAVRIRAQMKADIEHLSLIATLLVAVILLFAYRSVRMLVLGLLPVLSGVIAGIAGVSLAFGFVHGITLGFGVTLIGEAVDYAIYLLTQTAPGAAPAATLPRIWPTLRLGMLTSVCGFSVMLLSSFIGFAQLGLFTITGLVVALAGDSLCVARAVAAQFHNGCITGLRRAAAGADPYWPDATFRCMVLAIAASLALGFHHGPYWDDELSSMSPVPAAEKSLDEQLRREMGAPDVRYLLVVQAPTTGAALEASEHVAGRLEALVAQGAIGGFDAPSTWLPSQTTQRARQAALPDAATLQANLAQAIEDTPFRPDTFAPFLADVAAARQEPLLQRADLNGSSLGLRLDTLLVQTHGRWLAMLPLRDVVDSNAVAQAVSDMHDNQLIFINLKAESDRLLATYLHEALMLSLAGSIAIVVLLSVSLRSPRRTIAVLLPLAAAVVCTAGLLLSEAGRLSIFNLFGLLLVVAVGSNYCLFFERAVPEADDLTRRRMIASLVIADLCTVIGFGVLAFSAIPVLHGIGLTVAIGACLSLLFGAIFSARSGEPTWRQGNP